MQPKPRGRMKGRESPAALDAEFQALVRNRYAHDPQAMTALGARLLVGDNAPRAPADGAAAIAEAAKKGDPDAWSYLAVLAAAGVGRPQSWAEALDALRYAHELGRSDAGTQIRLLRELGIQTACDVRAWLCACPDRMIREAPRILAYGHFLTPALCSHLIQRAHPRLVKAQVHDAVHGGLKIDPMRTSTAAVFSLIDSDVIIQLVRARVAHAADIPTSALEPTEVLHYAVGERYKMHVDLFHPALPGFAEQMRTKGQRVKTCLVYLNDTYTGGETDFPKIGVKFRGQAGEALVFDNVLPNGGGDMRTLHSGLPPKAGEKWLLSQWIRSKAQPVA